MKKSIANRRVTCFQIGVLLALATGHAFPHVVQEQTSRSSLSDTIWNPTEAKILKAPVVITNTEIGVNRTLTSNASGLYNAPRFVTGLCTLQVSAKGFSAAVLQVVVLTVGQDFVQNFTLKLGPVTQQVVVQDNPASVDTSSSDLSAAVQGQTMRSIPLNGRSWTDLAALCPGVTTIDNEAPTRAPDRIKRGLDGELNISGERPQKNSYLLDGNNINDDANAGPGSRLGSNLGVDALHELNVITTALHYGRTASGLITAVPRPGTNRNHGSPYECARNAVLNARNDFDPPQIPAFICNRFGGSFGGLIWKDSYFLFGDYEGVRPNQGLSVLDIVPPSSARAGNLLAGTVNPDPAAVIFLNTIYPLPNVGQTTGGIGNYTFSAYQVTSENYFTIRSMSPRIFQYLRRLRKHGAVPGAHLLNGHFVTQDSDGREDDPLGNFRRGADESAWSPACTSRNCDKWL